MENNTDIVTTIVYDITKAERMAALAALAHRKAQLDVGCYQLSFFILRKLAVYRWRIVMEDGKAIFAEDLTARDIQNFLNGRKTTLPKMYAILAYLAAVEHDRQSDIDDEV